MAFIFGFPFFPLDEQLTGTAQNDVIFGFGGDDTLRGRRGDDLLFGGDGDDVVRGGKGDDALLGGDGDDRLVGGEGDDFAAGGLGNDRFVGGDGNDVYAGDEGTDTVTYRNLDTDITLLASGVIDKGGLGQDQIFGMERIVGSDTGVNTIDGSDGSGTGAFVVDLSANDLEITGFPFGSLEFTVVNFQNVVGTQNDDFIKGDDGDNIIDGNGGHDTLVGTLGNDSLTGADDGFTVDYSDLGEVITLQTAGLAQKGAVAGFGPDFSGALGTDTLGGFDADPANFISAKKVIGATGEANTIDGTTRSGAVNVSVDLTAGTFEAEVVEVAPNFPAFLTGITFGFEIENFVNVVGTDNDDVIKGSDEDNVIFGSEGSDVLQAGDSFAPNGFDTLDYSELDGSVEVAAAGAFTKREADGTLIGVDTVGDFDLAGGQIEVFEKVIGADGFANTLNGAGAFANVDVDLGAGTITATVAPAGFGGFAGGTSFGFEVVNFVNAVGSDLDDTIVGSDEDNVIFGSEGSDVLQAGDSFAPNGFDTLDYSGLDGSVEVAAAGAFTKREADGTLIGVDTVGDFDLAGGQIEVFEKVIGAAGFRNTLNGAGAFANIVADLGAGTVSATVAPGGFGGFAGGTSFGFLVENFVDVIGSDLDDEIIGDAQDNVVFGSHGSDTLQGGAGNDTLDYTGAGLSVSVAPGGVYSKTSGGVDVGEDIVGTFGLGAITVFETVIGDTGLDKDGEEIVNTLDASDSSGNVRVEVDLSAERIDAFVVNGFGGFNPGDSFGFDVVNFQNAAGTAADDEIIGDAQDNVIFGSEGSDVLRGGDGFDTADYSDLGAAITLQTAGMVLKDGGAAGTDMLGFFDPNDLSTFETFEKVVGATGETNVVDATSRSGAVNVTVNLAAGTFESEVVNPVGGFPAFTLGTTFGFEIENFVDVIGTDNEDDIIGSNAANALFGNGGDDEIRGRGGDDDIRGAGGDDLLVGQSGDDDLNGGGGADTLNGGDGDDFLLAGGGDDRVVGGDGADTFAFNLNSGAKSDALAGNGTFTRVNDFSLEDAVQFFGVGVIDAADAFAFAQIDAVDNGVEYRLASTTNNDQIQLRFDADGGGTIDNDELFARLILDDINDFLAVA